ncbi:MAG: hypothetical protein JXP34_05040 [Planctomycetes bacterium]|nr:hypothetical protein [Planctomycetota bacterium]
MSRRAFLGAGAAAAGGLILTGKLDAAGGGVTPEEAGWPALPPIKIYTVYAGRTGGIYLSRPTEEIARFDAYLREVEKKLGDVRFIGGDLIPPAKIPEIQEKMRGADAALLFHLSGHGGDAPVLDQLIDVGLPTIVFSQPFSGHGWMYFPKWQKTGKKVVPLVTSDWKEMERAARLLRVPARMRQSRIVVVNHPMGTGPAKDYDAIKAKLGAEIVPVSIDDTCKMHQAIDLKVAEAEAEEYWLSKAKRIVEPTREEIVSSARFYLAMEKFMIAQKARAITSSGCMGRPAKGCLAFSKLNDMGMVGACEGDMDSTLTMMLFGYALDLPGFISDPVFDTAKNCLVHFHCTSATRMDGRSGERLPFSIRTQSDSEQGVALEVENRIGQVVTCAKFVNLDTMLISTGKIFDVTFDELGCRTQFWTEVGDARAMFNNWGGGVLTGDTMTLLHRDVFYGDHVQSMKDLGALMGFQVVMEA